MTSRPTMGEHMRAFGEAAADAAKGFEKMAKAIPAPKVVLFKSTGNGKWYFHKKNRNGRKSNPSQGYASKWNAKRAIGRDKDLADLPIEEVAF